MLRGVPIGGGIVIARVFRPDEAGARRAATLSPDARTIEEAARLDAAVHAVDVQLDAVVHRVRHELSEASASIFRAHRTLLNDPQFFGRAKGFILSQRLTAEAALAKTFDEYAALFARVPDPALRERLADVRDVVGRLSEQLTLEGALAGLPDGEPVVLAVAEILPSYTVMFDKMNLAGIVAERGGSTGHGAILARAMGLPAVVGVDGLLAEMHTGDSVILDGREGTVIPRPGPEAELFYRKVQREASDARQARFDNRDEPARTADGRRIQLLANVNYVIDAATATGAGADGVGLYRTEFLFLSHLTIPSEDEQMAAYKAVFEAVPGQPITIRTLDLGGDKQVTYLNRTREANPFLGHRSSRLVGDHPEIFRTQLRAILRAAAGHDVRVLLPMITAAEEITQFRAMLRDADRELKREGLPHADSVPLGVMVEIPAAAVCLDQWLPDVEFVSIGSNDLTQYLMAADRDNPKTSTYCEPFHPAIYRLMRRVVRVCRRGNKPVSLCGEMASRPECLLPLLGMGLRRFSVSPGLVPRVKALMAAATTELGREALRRVVRLRTSGEVARELARLTPKLD